MKAYLKDWAKAVATIWLILYLVIPGSRYVWETIKGQWATGKIWYEATHTP